MNKRPACLVSYFAAWNAADIDTIRQHVTDAFETNGRYLDPKRSTVGIDEFTACLAAFRRETPNATISWASGVDSHHNLHRYAWELQVDARKVTGYDVIEVSAQQRIVSVLSFFGPLPPVSP